MSRIQGFLKAIVDKRKETEGLTQQKLAEQIGATPGMVSALLSGERRFNEDWIEKFCDILGITLGDIEQATPYVPEPQPLKQNLEKLRKLYEIPESPGFRCISDVMDYWLEAIKSERPEQNSGRSVVDFVKPPEVKESAAIDYDNPKHEHDAPREEIYEELPFYDQFRVPAGKPDEVTSDGTVSVRKVVRHLAKGNRYVIRVRGDSMEPRIQDGDLILVDHFKEPRPGQTVIALLNGAAVVKKFIRRGEQVILRSANPRYSDIGVNETDQFQIAGVVLRIVEGVL